MCCQVHNRRCHTPQLRKVWQVQNISQRNLLVDFADMHDDGPCILCRLLLCDHAVPCMPLLCTSELALL